MIYCKSCCSIAACTQKNKASSSASCHTTQRVPHPLLAKVHHWLASGAIISLLSSGKGRQQLRSESASIIWGKKFYFNPLAPEATTHAHHTNQQYSMTHVFTSFGCTLANRAAQPCSTTLHLPQQTQQKGSMVGVTTYMLSSLPVHMFLCMVHQKD